MKLLLLAIIIALVGCASGAKKTETKKAENKTTTEVKKEVTKAVKKDAEKKPVIESPVKGSKKVTCSAGDMVRIIENSFSDGGGCEVLYTKEGQTSTVASAQNELDYCQEVVDRMSGKLFGAGFKCE